MSTGYLFMSTGNLFMSTGYLFDIIKLFVRL